jgi:hypothetical protein
MTRLIVTNDTSAAGGLKFAGRADIAIPLERRLVWGRAPSDAEQAAFFAARTTQPEDLHWLDYTPLRRLERLGAKNLGLIEFCASCESVELWIDPDPNAQLQLIWLLNYLRAHQEIASRLTLIQAGSIIGDHPPEKFTHWQPRAVTILGNHFKAASEAWRAYRASTPTAWFSLLAKDLRILPRLRKVVLELLEELPMPASGLGATEMRMLELISKGGVSPGYVFPGYRHRNKRRVFGYWEIGELLDGLAHCPAPAVSGLDEGPFTLEMMDDSARRERYHRSKLRLTPLGTAVLEGREDFSRHNPIHRWWGGTKLTNKRLWRWDPVDQILVPPSGE